MPSCEAPHPPPSGSEGVRAGRRRGAELRMGGARGRDGAGEQDVRVGWCSAKGGRRDGAARFQKEGAGHVRAGRRLRSPRGAQTRRRGDVRGGVACRRGDVRGGVACRQAASGEVWRADRRRPGVWCAGGTAPAHHPRGSGWAGGAPRPSGERGARARQCAYAMPRACLAAMRAKVAVRPALMPVKLLG